MSVKDNYAMEMVNVKMVLMSIGASARLDSQEKIAKQVKIQLYFFNWKLKNISW